MRFVAAYLIFIVKNCSWATHRGMQFLYRLVEMQIRYIKKQIRIKAVLVKYMSEYFYIHLYANTEYFKSKLMA